MESDGGCVSGHACGGRSDDADGDGGERAATQFRPRV